ncbi:hypothetical protein LTR49_026847 [Elasticomyces elasticus]|nr:hypothetical protein LTR49_026847 [Elasticomyces elasticus]
MSSITYKATRAKISKERAAKARNALEKQHQEIATQQKQQDSDAPFIFLDKRDDEVKAAMDAFQSTGRLQSKDSSIGGTVASQWSGNAKDITLASPFQENTR